MSDTDKMEKMRETIENFLSSPSTDPRLIPLAEEIIEAVRAAVADSEDLRRYREARDRMGSATKYSFMCPNFPYTIHSV